MEGKNSPMTQRRVTSRRTVLRGAVGAGTVAAAGAIPALSPRTAPTAAAATRSAQTPADPASVTLIPPQQAVTMWYATPAVETALMQQCLPVGNGLLGALTTGDPADDAVNLTDGSFWQGTANTTLDSDGDGQFPYAATDFGTLGVLATARLGLPAHTTSAISGYRRQLDLSNGLASVTYQLGPATYRRDIYISHPDDVLVIHLTQTGGGTYTGSFSLAGTHTETVAPDGSLPDALSFTGTLTVGGERYAAIAGATATGGTLSVSGSSITFANCSEIVLVLSAGTDYSASAPGYLDAAITPLTDARTKAKAALAQSGSALLRNHLADYQRPRRRDDDRPRHSPAPRRTR